MLDLSSKGSAQALEVRLSTGKLFSMILGGIVFAVILFYDLEYADAAKWYSNTFWHLERFFIVSTMFCFVMSLLTYVTGLLARYGLNARGNVPLKFFDLAYYAFAAVLLTVAVILYLTSTWEVHFNAGVAWSSDSPCYPQCRLRHWETRAWEKTGIAVTTLANALMCARIAVLLARDRIHFGVSPTTDISYPTSA